MSLHFLTLISFVSIFSNISDSSLYRNDNSWKRINEVLVIYVDNVQNYMRVLQEKFVKLQNLHILMIFNINKINRNVQI